MKSTGKIVEKLFSSTQFKPLGQHRCYRMFLDLLPPRFRNAIAFVTIKNGRLMVGLSHPGYKMELNYNQELLKSLLSTLRAHRPECAFMEAGEIVFFLSKYARQPEEESATVPRYSELATGNFDASLENPELAESFLRIRRWIEKNRSRGR